MSKIKTADWVELYAAMKSAHCYIPKHVIAPFTNKGATIDDVFNAAKNAYAICGNMNQESINLAFKDEMSYYC